MGDQTGTMGGGGFYQAPRGWGPPPGAVSGRGGVYLDGQRLQPVPGVSGGWFNPRALQGGSGGIGGGGDPKTGVPQGGGMGAPMAPANPWAPATPPRPGGITQAVQAMQRGDMTGAQAYARQGAGLPQAPAAPRLNTTAQVQTAPMQPQGQTLDQWRQKYLQTGFRQGGGVGGGGALPPRPQGR